MTQFLPPNLLALFAPRDAIPFKAPVDKVPCDKKRAPYGGLAEYINLFEDPKDTPAPTKAETKEERKERKHKERAELQAYKIEQGIALWNASENPSATTDPYKTLFVSRLNYDTSESKLRREFEVYGPIKRIIPVHNTVNSKPRGYAFIEYEHERDMHAAYKHADGKKIDDRRVLVDVERGRTVKGWLPRRFGGGLGNTRKARAPAGEFGDEEPSRERERERGGRSRDRDRDRDRDRGDRRDNRSDNKDRDRDAPRKDRDRKRSRSRSKDRRRGGSRDNKDRDRDRKERRGGDRDRDHRRRSRDRDSRRDKSGRNERDVRVKEEPADKPSATGMNYGDDAPNNYGDNGYEDVDHPQGYWKEEPDD